jgi:hypothetical protein
MRFKTSVASGGGTIGRLFSSAFFLIFFAAGTLFTIVVVRSAWNDAQSRSWPSADCTIVESSVVEPSSNNGAPAVRVAFEYTYDGRGYRSERLTLDAAQKQTDDAYQLVQQRYRPGTRTICHVDPKNPGGAILETKSSWSFLVVLFPLIFVAIGAGGIFFTWKNAHRPGPDRPMSDAAADRAGTPGPRSRLLFFGVFLAVGVLVTHAILVRPLLRIRAARHWSATPCEIISSRVRSHSGEHGSTYSVDTVYRYRYQGRAYTSNRYRFQAGSSSGYEGKAQIVAHYPPGKKTTCYVNPADPTDAVLDPGYSAALWFGLIPLIFVAVGAGGIFHTLKTPPGGLAAPAPWRSPVTANAGFPAVFDSSGPGELKPKGTRLGKFIGLTVFALFWNGIVAVFLVNVIGEWRSNQHPWFLTLFLTPFVAVGLAVIIGAGKALLGFFNPRPRLNVSQREVPLGGTVEIGWTVEGRADTLKNLRLTLEGSEAATYRRGTDTQRDTAVFATLEIASVEGTGIRQGTAQLQIPADTMHSFQSKNNQIQWTLRVRGEIPRWPDLNDEFPLTVLPQPIPATKP